MMTNRFGFSEFCQAARPKLELVLCVIFDVFAPATTLKKL
jgi:hypothetical protein